MKLVYLQHVFPQMNQYFKGTYFENQMDLWMEQGCYAFDIIFLLREGRKNCPHVKLLINI